MRWYELACQLARTPTRVLKDHLHLSRPERSSMRAIARLHPEIGLLLDDLEAPWNLVRKVAHAPGPAARWKRAEQLLTQLIEKRAAEDPSRARGARTRLERLLEAVKPNDPVLRQAQALDAERYKPPAGAVRSAAARRSA